MKSLGRMRTCSMGTFIAAAIPASAFVASAALPENPAKSKPLRSEPIAAMLSFVRSNVVRVGVSR